MKVEIQKLAQGSNPFTLTIEQERLHTWVREVDDLYFARVGGADVRMDLYRTEDLVHLTGSIEGRIGFACASCLKEQETPLSIPLSWSLLPSRSLRLAAGATEEDVVELDEDDLDVSFYTEEGVELEDLAREAILLELEACPRCSVDDCGPSEYTPRSSPDASTEAVDSRWAALKAIKLTDN